MNIGEASAASGVSAKMIRHYESIGLVPTADRTEAGYRIYDKADVCTLRFVHHARDLGLPLDKIGEILGLWRNPNRTGSEVKRLALEHVAALEAKAAALRAVAAALHNLAEACDCGRRPGYPDCSSSDEGAAAPQRRGEGGGRPTAACGDRRRRERAGHPGLT
ncbi:MerR family DNA-binding transcriptional regulator [Roseomonas frigidaquae]|uniref:MerR family DNA-binding transcriptional regulator n=1 Tax=Falsiroseomonas frigidaquae TaxID=487318 RepID=A0ABX1F8F2_9PROT|nr:MerR family DNA-binding transcriptional regulator [Falsiroseomonas frigidaquae]